MFDLFRELMGLNQKAVDCKLFRVECSQNGNKGI